MASDFSSYMREKLLERGIRQQQVFRGADISEKYGYKLISGEKHTRQRDIIIKLCFAAGFTLDELSEALILYGMAPLYPGNGRDVVLMRSISDGIREISDINDRLEQGGYEKLYESRR
ncbi:MAG: hypothetical protein IKI75_00015 [Lachnospiraceae bacterium]|nr:hypothetical protein [Lachnospiraceae bacterium]